MNIIIKNLAPVFGSPLRDIERRSLEGLQNTGQLSLYFYFLKRKKIYRAPYVPSHRTDQCSSPPTLTTARAILLHCHDWSRGLVSGGVRRACRAATAMQSQCPLPPKEPKRVCTHCGKPLSAIGHARKNGAKHADWQSRHMHKACWKATQPARPRPKFFKKRRF